MNLLQVKTLQELVEEVRRCACAHKCNRCKDALTRMDTILDRAYEDAVRKGINGKKVS